jgi:hypothetical protein
MAHRVERENAEEARANEGPRPIRHNLADAFDMCGNQQVHKTPSANIVVAMNELAKLPQSSALDAVLAYLKAATVLVNENRLGGHAPAPSVASSHSRRPHGS